MDVNLTSSTPVGTRQLTPKSHPDLFAVAQSLEANFIAEMLKSTGLGATSEHFGGGIGEDQFASFLRQAHADELSKQGGFGFAESIYQSLLERI